MYNYFKQITFSLCLLAILSIFTQCKEEAEMAEIQEQLVEVLQFDQSKLVEADNSFSWKLFQKINEKQLAEAPNGNVFASPFNVAMALAMLYNGADGTTKEAIQSTLELDDLTIQQVNATYKRLAQQLTTADRAVILNIANSIWMDMSFPTKPDFLSTNQLFFDSEVQELNFADDASVDVINNWVNDKTNGTIESILEEINPDEVMFLISAIYFNANWRYPFAPEATQTKAFHLADGSTTNCEMMTTLRAFPYYENELFQAVDLMYGDSLFSMTILQPHEDVDINELIGQLDNKQWEEWINNNFVYDGVILEMPKFEVNYKKDLNEVLSDMGMGVAFSNGANLSRIADAPLYVSRVTHKAFVKVDEEGTEASAVTGIGIGIVSVPIYPQVILNRPFLYVIRDNQTGTVLFVGKMMNPSEEQ